MKESLKRELLKILMRGLGSAEPLEKELPEDARLDLEEAHHRILSAIDTLRELLEKFGLIDEEVDDLLQQVLETIQKIGNKIFQKLAPEPAEEQAEE